MDILKVEQLRKEFPRTIAVDDVSFAIAAGEIFSLIGPNGSGKSTIIKTIAGLLRPTRGTITVDGNDLVQKPIAAKSAIGYIPDEPSAWSTMTGGEFLHFSGALYGVPEDVRTKRMHELLQAFHLTGIEPGYFEDYSRGNKQKYAIIAALLHHPKLLLIDEPIVGLDPSSAAIAQELFLQFANNGGAVLLVTHTLSVAQRIAHRIGVLDQSKLVATGTFAELQTRAGLDASASLEAVYSAFTSPQ